MVKNNPIIDAFVPFDVPMGKGRGRSHPKFKNQQFSHIKVTTPTKTRNAMQKIAQESLSHFTDTDSDSIFKLRVIALFPRPERLKKVDEDKDVLIGLGGSYYPDWDNIGKLVSDALNGTVWKDDCQVADGRAIRRYIKRIDGVWEEPGIRFKIWIVGRKN